jgi:hypothetical protein
MAPPFSAYYVLTKAEASLTNSKLHPNSGAPDYNVSHAVADISDIDTSYLAIDGSNASSNIDIGTYDFTTTGTATIGSETTATPLTIKINASATVADYALKIIKGSSTLFTIDAGGVFAGRFVQSDAFGSPVDPTETMDLLFTFDAFDIAGYVANGFKATGGGTFWSLGSTGQVFPQFLAYAPSTQPTGAFEVWDSATEAVKLSISPTGNITTEGTGKFGLNFITSIKSGATQSGAGAAAKEIWKTSGHASLPDNVLMIGV